MKAYLMYPDSDFDLARALPANAVTLRQDLGLDTLFLAMASGDAFLLDVAVKGFFSSADGPGGVRYRQEILADCIAQPAVVREVYAIAVEAIERERRVWGTTLSRYPESMLRRSVDVLDLFLGLLKRLRGIADAHGGDFRSEGFTRFFRMVATELDDAYLQRVEDHIERLRFRDGVLMSAELGQGNRGTRYVLRRTRTARRSLRERLALWDRSGYVYRVADRDQAGLEALTELQGRGLSLAAAALAQSTDHILSFFSLLRAELGFYLGCLNLHERLVAKGEPVCFPDPLPAGRPELTCVGLYDVCLSLLVADRVVGNDVMAADRSLVVITGANRGGKSTFLRSVGIAQLLMQCGMFVPAVAYRADMRDGIFTHFKREEDPGMRSGKLDEELSRMSAIVDALTPGGMVLLNESFASTNEREGSEIARQIVRALVEAGVKVAYVTHMFDLAHGFYGQGLPTVLCLRAERTADGERTFRVLEGEPLPTSHGVDIYRRVFAAQHGPGSGDPGPVGSLAVASSRTTHPRAASHPAPRDLEQAEAPASPDSGKEQS